MEIIVTKDRREEREMIGKMMDSMGVSRDQLEKYPFKNVNVAGHKRI